MARTGQSKTVKLANGNRVTVTTGYNRSGYYRTVSVRRPDGTAESRTDRKNIGFLNTGLFDVSGGYSNGVPQWAGGTKGPNVWPFIIGLVVVVLVLAWPWAIHPRWAAILVACIWYLLLLLLAFGAMKRASGAGHTSIPDVSAELYGYRLNRSPEPGHAED